MLQAKRIRRVPLAAVLSALVILLTAGFAAAQTEPGESAGETGPAVRVELAFGTGLDKTTRSLEGEGTAFAAADFTGETGQIFCLSRVVDMKAPGAVTHVWYHEGKTMARVELTVGSGDWRTWSSKLILPSWTGAWEVKVLDANGMVLATSGFVIN